MLHIIDGVLLALALPAWWMTRRQWLHGIAVVARAQYCDEAKQLSALGIRRWALLRYLEMIACLLWIGAVVWESPIGVRLFSRLTMLTVLGGTLLVGYREHRDDERLRVLLTEDLD